MTLADLLYLTKHFLLACGGTLCFGLLFGIPRRTYLACAVDGAVGWAVYQMVILLMGDGSAVTAILLASVPLTLLARIFAIKLKAPVTVFLLCGIFPLVPGAGIYYTAYYFILDDNQLFMENGLNTLKVAIALAIGISLVLGMPLPRPKKKQP